MKMAKTTAERDKALEDLCREADFLPEVMVFNNEDVMVAKVKRMLRVAYEKGKLARVR